MVNKVRKPLLYSKIVIVTIHIVHFAGDVSFSLQTMFYAHFMLSKKGPLARIWLAAHWKVLSTGTSFRYLPALSICFVQQRFSNWGPRTKGGPRRVPMGSTRGFRKVVIVCKVFNNLRPICFQICKHKSVNQSQCIAWKCCRGLARQAFC